MANSFDGDIRLSVGLDTGQAEKDAKKLGEDVAAAVDSKAGKSSKILELEAQLRKAKDAAADAKKKLDELKDIKMPTDEFAALEEQARELADRYAELAELRKQGLEMGIDLASTDPADQAAIATLKALEQEMDEVYAAAERATEKMAEMMRTGTAYKTPESTSEWSEAARQVNYTTDRVEVLEAKLREARAAENGAANTVEHGASKAASAFARLRSVGAAAGRALANGLKAAAAAAGRLAANLARAAGRAVITGLRKIASGVTGIGRRADSTKLSLGRLLKYAVGLIGLGTLLGKMRTAIADGFKTLAKSDANLNARLSETKAALAGLKLSFASAFQPILTVVLPIINALANALTNIINKIGMFFAVLTGQSYYNKAIVSNIEGYAGAIEDTGAAAASAAEEVEKYLSPVDELNKLQDPSKTGSGGSGSGGSGGGGGGGEAFEQVAIESPISDLANKIKALINAEDWEGLGALLAEKVNGGLQKIYDAISWDNVGPKITYFINAFTTTFNSLVDNIDWDLMGRTVGTGINTLVNTLDLLISGINWVNLGKKFAVGANGLIDEVEWENLGAMIGRKLMILPNLASGFVDELNWEELGDAIARSFNAFFETFSLPNIVETLGKLINGAITSISSFNDTFEWDKASEQISGAINKFFETVSAEDLASGVGHLLINIQTAITNILEDIEWEDIAQWLSDLLSSIPWEEIINSALTMGQTLFNKLQQFIADFITTTPWNEIISSILMGIWDWLTGGGFGWEEFLLGIWNTIYAILIDLPVKVLLGVADFLCKIIFGKTAQEVWDDIVNWFTNLWQTVWDAVCAAWDACATFFSTLWNDWICKPFMNAATWFGNIFVKAWEAVCAAWDTCMSFFSKVWNDWICKPFMKAVEWFGNIFAKAWEAVCGAWNACMDFFGKVWDEWICKPFVNAAKWFGDIFKGAWEAVCNAWDAAGLWFQILWENIKLLAVRALEGILDFLDKTLGWIPGLGDSIRAAKDSVAGVADDIQRHIDELDQQMDEKLGKKREIQVALATEGMDKVMQSLFGSDAGFANVQATITGKVDGTFSKLFGSNGKDGSFFQITQTAGTEANKNAKTTATAQTGDSFVEVFGATGKVITKTKETSSKANDQAKVTWTGALSNGLTTALKGASTAGSVPNKVRNVKTNISSHGYNEIKWFSGGLSDGLKKMFAGAGTYGSAANYAKRAADAASAAAKITMSGGSTTTLRSYINDRIGEMNRALMNIANNSGASKFFGAVARFIAIPKLAQGAVIPAGAPFLAMLGDQTAGRNLEAPESLIRQIVREETAAIAGVKGGSTKVVAQVGRKTLFEIVVDEAKLQRQATGRNPFDI